MTASIRLICTQGPFTTTQERVAQLPALVDFLAGEGEAPVMSITVPHSRAAVRTAMSDDSMEHLEDSILFDVLVVRTLLGHCRRIAHGLSPDLRESKDMLAGCAVLIHTALDIPLMQCAECECAFAWL